MRDAERVRAGERDEVVGVQADLGEESEEGGDVGARCREGVEDGGEVGGGEPVAAAERDGVVRPAGEVHGVAGG